MQQTDVTCNNCECYIEDARSVIRVNQVLSSCFNRPTAVTWYFYGTGRRYLGFARGTGCCYATLRVSYIPEVQTTTTRGSTAKREPTTEYYTKEDRNTSSSLTSVPPVGLYNITNGTTQKTTSTGLSTQSTFRVGNGKLVPTGSKEILYGGLAGAGAVFVIMLIIACLCLFKKYGRKSSGKMALRESCTSASDMDDNDFKSNYSVMDNNNAKEPQRDSKDTSGDNYYVIERGDEGLSGTPDRYSLVVDVNVTPRASKADERTYFVLQKSTKSTKDRNSKNTEEKRASNESKIKRDASKEKKRSSGNESKHNSIDNGKLDRNSIYNNLYERDDAASNEIGIYNELDISNDNYDHLWSANLKKDQTGTYGLFSANEIVMNENSIYFNNQ